MNVLMVQPNFPIPAKSRNHKNFLPIGLLKIASMERQQSNNVVLVNGLQDYTDFDKIYITSYFTYWSKYVKEAVEHYRKLNPDAEIIVGGIYASLMPEHCREYTGCDVVETGQIAEDYPPAYDLVDVDYQILHTTRGCTRRCKFCGSYIIEDEYTYKSSIRDEVFMRKLVFYDNNFLANPFVEDILQELIELKRSRKIVSCECQSGFDGRVLLKKPHLAEMLKKAGFISPKIAWDGSFLEEESIRKQIDILKGGGYSTGQIGVFLLYNFDINYYECEYKRSRLFDWGIQVMDSRFRPLDLVEDNYNPRKFDDDSYWIHQDWTNEQVRMFRKNVRRHNISIRQNMKYHSKYVERKQIDNIDVVRKMSYCEAKGLLDDAYCPAFVDYIN